MTRTTPPWEGGAWNPPRDLLVRLSQLETRVRDLETAVIGNHEPAFTAPGKQIAPITFKETWVAPHRFQCNHASITLGTAPDGGAAKGSFYVNGILLVQVTVPTGQRSVTTTMVGTPTTIERGDLVTVSVDESPGTEESWVFQLELERIP